MAAVVAVGGGWAADREFWSDEPTSYVLTADAAPKLALLVATAVVLLWAWYAYRRALPPR